MASQRDFGIVDTNRLGEKKTGELHHGYLMEDITGPSSVQDYISSHSGDNALANMSSNAMTGPRDTRLEKTYFQPGKKEAGEGKTIEYDEDEAKEYYDAYHNAINDFIKEMKVKFPTQLPLLLDIHGQSAKLDSVLRGTANGKTYPFLLNKHGIDGIIGKKSLLHHLGTNGITIYPDCSVPLETSTELLGYTGVFTVCYYSGHSVHKFDNPVDSIQLEIGKSFRKPKTHLPKLETYSLHLAGAIDSHLSNYS